MYAKLAAEAGRWPTSGPVQKGGARGLERWRHHLYACVIHNNTYIYIYIHTYIHTYIYIYVERERDRYRYIYI